MDDRLPSTFNPYLIGDIKDANITLSGIRFGLSLTANASSARCNTKGWTNTAKPDTDDYFTVTGTPNFAYKINFISVDCPLQLSITGLATFAVRSSLDSHVTNIESITVSGTTSSAKIVTLAGISFQNISREITFRIYGYSAIVANGTSCINNFPFKGQVVNVQGTEDFELLKLSYDPNPIKDILNLLASGPGLLLCI